MSRALSSYKIDRKPNKKGDPNAEQWNYVRELATEILTGVPVEHFVSQAMDRGAELEPQARKYYCEQMGFTDGKEVKEVGFVLHPTFDWLGASPDAIVGDKGCLEIKAPEPTTHLDYLSRNDIPEDYVYQVHTEILCCEAEWCDFVSYSPLYKHPDLRMKRIRVYRNEAIIREIEEGALRFWERVCERVQKAFGGVESDPTMGIPALPSPEASTRPALPSTGDLTAQLKASVKREEERLSEIDEDWETIIEGSARKRLTFPSRSGNWEKIF
jgi:hypothetical protein